MIQWSTRHCIAVIVLALCAAVLSLCLLFDVIAMCGGALFAFLVADIEWKLAALPITVFAYFFGQYLGARIRRRKMADEGTAEG